MKITRKQIPMANERGSATILFISLLAVMMILVTAQSRNLLSLRREVKLLDQQQIKRLNASQTNALVAAKPESK